MAVTLPLDSMSVEEKLQTMESIWDDLCKKADGISSPPWHEKVFNERNKRVKRGEDKFIDWETAKRKIRYDIS